jgi:hypothetical protein
VSIQNLASTGTPVDLLAFDQLVLDPLFAAGGKRLIPSGYNLRW